MSCSSQDSIRRGMVRSLDLDLDRRVGEIMMGEGATLEVGHSGPTEANTPLRDFVCVPTASQAGSKFV